jgi:hypothetical protein
VSWATIAGGLGLCDRLRVRLLSFSLYGSDPIYCLGAVRNAELAPEIYPGWRIRFAVDASVPADVLERLRALGAEIVTIHKSLGPEYGKFWRFLVAADPTIERFACRDADSRLNVREKAAVDEWIASGLPFHVMRDSAHHDRCMLGGMWGGVGGLVPDIAGLVDGWGHYERWGDSDRFLSQVVWPGIRGRTLCHDSFGHFGDGRPFPPHQPLEGTCYVGEIVPVDEPTFDVWREVGVLRDRIVRLHGELARREAEIARQIAARQAVEAELGRRAATRAGGAARSAARASRLLLRRMLAGLERRPPTSGE